MVNKYNAMSDFEINKRVADCLGVAWHVIGSDGSWVYADKYCELGDGGKAIDLPDYCNNPADAWPIIVENKIFTRYDDVVMNQWMAGLNHQNIVGLSNNPLRAAMIVYLMMIEGE